MPTLDWLRQEFHYGYDSGNVLARFPDRQRRQEERRIGGSYRKVFLKAISPYLKPDSRVLELGPGRGSWSLAILKYLPQGELHTVDFQDVTRWLDPSRYHGRLVCHQVTDNSFNTLEDNFFDVFWSFGVLCHNNVQDIRSILQNTLPKMKRGGVGIHQYGDWNKLSVYGWKRGAIPVSFRTMPDDAIWWPRNSQQTMSYIATESGWEVRCADLDLLKRDALMVMRCP